MTPNKATINQNIVKINRNTTINNIAFLLSLFIKGKADLHINIPIW